MTVTAPPAAVQRVLDRLPGARQSGTGWMARCPAHDDRNPSLSIAVGTDGRALLTCHASCPTDRVVSALGLELADLFPEAKARPAGPRPRSRSRPRPKVTEYQVRDSTGALVAVHRRVEEPDGWKRFTWPKGTRTAELPLYGSERAPEWDLDRPVVVTEGEKAADAVLAAGLQAVGTVTGAAGTPSDGALAVLAAADVVLWPDADQAGRDHMDRIAARIRDVAARTRMVRWPDAPTGADAADLPAERIRELVASAVDPAAPDPTVGMDAADLLALELPPLRWIVPDLLPEGTTILAGQPKLGKSSLTYQVAVEVAVGGELFGRRVTPGAALYLALEDGRRRGQERLRSVLAGRTMPRGRLEVRWSCRKIGEGLEEDILAWLLAHPDAALVAIDTLGKVRPRSNGRRGAYEVDVEDLARLQRIFADRPVALLIVHHARKQGSDDFLATVSGTYGLSGSADTIAVVKRNRHERFGTIEVTGRDVPDAELSVRFDSGLWSSAPAALSHPSVQRAEVYRAIEELGPIFAIGIVRRLHMARPDDPDEVEKRRQAVQHMLKKLQDEGAIVGTSRGYVVADSSRARTGTTLPVHSLHSLSEDSEGGHARGHARELDPDSVEGRYERLRAER